MYIAWEELKRGIGDEDRKESATQIMDAFTENIKIYAMVVVKRQRSSKRTRRKEIA